MKIFTFTSTKGNYCDGEYDFMADQWTEALQMATNFERVHNKRTYKIKFNINRNSVKMVIAMPGFIKMTKLLK